MSKLTSWVNEFCSSEHFLLQVADGGAKAHAERLLAVWCEGVGDLATPAAVDAGLMRVAAQADVGVETRREFPNLLSAFFDYLHAGAGIGDAAGWATALAKVEEGYRNRLRKDGTVRGETVRNIVASVGRNELCPCGSGKKFKRCCMSR